MVDATMNGNASGAAANAGTSSSSARNGSRTGEPIDPINVIIDKLQK
jgi:hypothetical protein